MTDEQATSLVNAVKRIEIALMGDVEMGQLGLIKQQQSDHARIRRIEQWGTTIVTASGIVALIYKVATDWWPKK